MKKVYRMEELDCANCAAKMERLIAQINGVQSVSLSFMTQKISIEFTDNANIDAIMKEAQKICRKIEPDCRIIV